MALLPSQYAKVLYELTKDAKGKALDTAIVEFLRFLKAEQVLSKMPYIMNAFERYAKQQEGVAQLHITSARPLTKKQVAEITKSFGKKAEVETSVDPALIGGIVVRTANTIIDGSVKTQLEHMKSSLI